MHGEAPASVPVEQNGSAVSPAKALEIATETAPGSVVESPTTTTAPQTPYSEGGMHLSGHEARVFPGIYTRGALSGSVRKEDGAVASTEPVEKTA